MNGVMMPSVSAGSSQRDAKVMCTPHVTVPSGAAAAGRETANKTRQVTRTMPSRMIERLMVTSRSVGSANDATDQGTGSSADDPSAHDPDRVPGDVGRRVGGEEDARLRDVLGPAETTERDLRELFRRARRRLTKLRIPLGVAPLGVDEPRHHHVHADAERPELGGERAHETDET